MTIVLVVKVVVVVDNSCFSNTGIQVFSINKVAMISNCNIAICTKSLQARGLVKKYCYQWFIPYMHEIIKNKTGSNKSLGRVKSHREASALIRSPGSREKLLKKKKKKAP